MLDHRLARDRSAWSRSPPPARASRRRAWSRAGTRRPRSRSRPPEAHELALAGQRRQREAVGERLAERREIGDDAVQSLRAADVPAKAGDHLVEDEQRAIARGRALHAGRNPGAGSSVRAASRNTRGDLPGVRREQRAQRCQVVVVELHGLVVDAARDAAVGRGRADEPVVVGEERLVGADRDEVAAGVARAPA